MLKSFEESNSIGHSLYWVYTRIDDIDGNEKLGDYIQKRIGMEMEKRKGMGNMWDRLK